ncbi:MAG: thermonuclease family protein, partial [Pirellulaceae bacterium]|nr:thermonuclease family protein [Pirellulaceae bacterium]
DTCTLLVGKEEYKIRLEGIDTPEMGQAFGKRAKQALSGYIFGKQVTAKLSGQDRYQRYLGTIMLDGQNVNLQMVKDGCAWHYKNYSSDEVLAQAESDARAARRGLWEDGDAMAPWDWRSKGSKKTAAKDTTTSDQEIREIPATVSHWLNTSSGIRHNRKCHQFGKTKSGRSCGAQDGRACKVCGG